MKAAVNGELPLTVGNPALSPARIPISCVPQFLLQPHKVFIYDIMVVYGLVASFFLFMSWNLFFTFSQDAKAATQTFRGIVCGFIAQRIGYMRKAVSWAGENKNFPFADHLKSHLRTIRIHTGCLIIIAQLSCSTFYDLIGQRIWFTLYVHIQ